MENSGAETSTAKPVHLIVLQHGLWGKTSDVGRLTEYLEKHFEQQAQSQERVQIINTAVNSGKLTYDGIDVCGSRLATFIQETIQQIQEEQGAQVTKLSLIGYSLGGLIVRYAAGKLYVAGLFEDVQPVNLITIATPHLGSFKEPTSFWARFFNSQVPVIASRTGMQLMLQDVDYTVPWLAQQQALHDQAHEQHEQQHPQQQHQKQQQQQEEEEGVQQSPQSAGSTAGTDSSSSSSRSKGQQRQRSVMPPGTDPDRPVPLLLLMAHPAGPFHGALRAFRTRICAANIKYDTTVPYCTAAICTHNPYEEQLPVPINADKYPSVVRPALADEQVEAVEPKGRYRLYVFMAFLPLFPAFWAYTATKGIMHHRQASRQPLSDLTWLQQYQAQLQHTFSRQTSRQSDRQQQQGGTAVGLAAVIPHSSYHTAAPAAADVEAVDLLAAVHHSEEARESTAAAVAAAAAAGSQVVPSAAVGKLQDPFAAALPVAEAATELQAAGLGASLAAGDEQQLHSKTGTAVAQQMSSRLSSGVLEHEGIVEAPLVLYQQQKWMAQQLYNNMPPCVTCSGSSGSGGSGSGGSYKLSGGWHRVDVCTGHMHSHAAVIVRDARYEQQSRDLFEYLANHMTV